MMLHFLAPRDKTKWSQKWHTCLESWKKYHCCIKVWDDEEIDDFIKCNDPEFYKTLKILHKIFRLDYVRSLILEKMGGAYIDMDMELKSPFLHQLNNKNIYIVGASAGDEIVQNSLMISPPSEFWTRFLTYSRKNIFENLEAVRAYPDYKETIRGTIVRKTVGPIALSNFIKQDKQHIEILPADLFNNSKGISFTKHHQTGIWGFID
jgi:mannosyltransferase OCH1-like enzyme